MSSSLAEGYTLRPATPEDAPAVAELMNACEADETEETMSAHDVLHFWHGLDLARNTLVVVAPDGSLAGVAEMSKRGDALVVVDGYVHPDHNARGVGTTLVELGEKRARELMGGRGCVHIPTLTSNEAATSLLERRGYRDARHFLRMVIDLDDDPPPEPQWPEGLDARPFQEEHAAAFHAALEDAFADEWGHAHEPYEDWHARRVAVDGFDPTLWRAVWDGEEIAAVIVVDWQRFGMGWVGSVGVRGRWRRRGLGENLLRWAIRELHSRGERRVGLGVDAENPTGAGRLYERVGMRVIWDAAVYEKELT
ncbi:MAG: mycothiol synthase [Gaiellaceae bacterium]|jgi:mycothiol synthase|nr:mycothiol synthase [Gaiellaceae bacterium]